MSDAFYVDINIYYDMHPKRTVNVKNAPSRGTRVFGRKNKNIRLETTTATAEGGQKKDSARVNENDRGVDGPREKKNQTRSAQNSSIRL